MTSQEESVQQVDIDTNIPEIKDQFFFHELIKQTSSRKHYIVEDLTIEVDESTEESNVFKYLKQTFLQNKQHFDETVQYYKKLISYCESQFAKNDIITYRQVFFKEDQKKNIYEVVSVCDFGESERIDVENIEKEHINKFLKNVCVLLSDLRKFDNIYHVLDNDELKLSGFQPIFKDDPNQLQWKREFIHNFGIDRFDLYLLGLLWLKFLNTSIDNIIDKNIPLQKFHQQVKEITKNLTKEQKMETVAKLIDIENCLNIDLDTVILNFDQYFIIQKIQIEQQDGSQNYESQDPKSNVFKKSMENDEVFTLKSPLQNFESGKQDSNNIINIEGNFTLQENQSVGYKLSNPETNVNLIKQNIVGAPQRRSIDTHIDKQQDFINKINSQRHLKQAQVNSLDNINPDFQTDRRSDDEDNQINYLSSKFEHTYDDDNDSKEENNEQRTKIDEDGNSEIEITNNRKNQTTTTTTVTTTVNRHSISKSTNSSKGNLEKKNSQKTYRNNTESNQMFEELEGQIKEEMSESQKELHRQQIQAAKERAAQKQKSLQKQQEQEKLKEQEQLDRKEKARKVRYNFKKRNEHSQSQINVENLKQQQEEDEEDSEEEKVVFGEVIKKKPKPNPELEAIIQKEIEEKKKRLEEKLRQEREQMKQIALKKQKEEKAMKDKIKRIAEMKRKKKKKQKTVDESNDNINRSINNKNNRSMAKNKNTKSNTQNNNQESNYQEFIQGKILKEDKPMKPSKSQTRVKNKLQLQKNSKNKHNVSIEELGKKIKKQMDISDYQQRAQMFEYDSNKFKNRQMPFKKIFDKAKGNQYFKEDKPTTPKQQQQKQQKQNKAEATYSPRIDSQFQSIEIGNDDEYYKKKIFQHDSIEKAPQRQSINKQELDDIYKQQEQQYGKQSSARKIDELLSKKRSNQEQEPQIQQYNAPQIIEKQITNKLSERDIQIAYPQGHNSQFESIQIFNTQNSYEKPNSTQQSMPKDEKVYYDENEDVYVSHYTDKFQDLNEEIEEEDQGLNSSIEEDTNKQSTLQKHQNPYEQYSQKEQANIQNYHVEKPTKQELQNLPKEPESSERMVDYNTNELNAIFNPKTNAKYGKKWKDPKKPDQQSKKVEDQFKEVIPQQKVSNLIKKKNKEEGLSKIETLKNLSILHFSKKNYGKSSQYLQEAIDILEKTKVQSKLSMINKLKFSIIINCVEDKDFDQAYKVLQTMEETEEMPPKFNIVKGDVLSKLQKNEEAFKSYIQELNSVLEENLTHKQNKQMFFIILIKITHVLLYFGEQEIVKFFNYILDILEQQVENGANEEMIHQMKVDFMMNLMNILLENKYFDLLNYFLNIIAQKKLIDLDYLTDNQKYIISKIYMQFSFYLKSIPNYGNQKEIYVNFLNHALFLIKEIKQTNVQVYNKMIELYLFKGIFFLKENAFGSAIDSLMQAYELLQTEIKNQIPQKIYYTILFNLSLSFFSQKKFKEALYYLEQINNSQCQDNEILNKAQKLLCKVYYILGLNERCCQNMKPFIQNIMKNKNPEEEDLKYLSIYFLCASQTKTTQHEDILQYLITRIKSDKYLLSKKYFFLFYNIYIIMKDDNKLEESEYFLGQLRKIMKQEGDDEKAEAFLVLINLMFTKYLLNKNDEAFKLNSKVIKGMQDKNKNISQNSKEIENYLYNFLLLIIGKLDDTQGGNLDKLKSEMIDQIKEFKENNKIYDKIYEILKKDNFKTSVLSFSVRSLNSSTFDSRKQTQKILDFQNQFYKQNIKQNQVEQPKINAPVHEKKKRFTKKKRLKSQELIRTSNFFKRPKCSCYQLNFNKNDLMKLIIDFFQQIKNMLFLNVTQKIDEYYQRFEEVINQKRINLEKFVYVKKLVRFYLEHKGKQLDEKLLYKLMQNVVENPDLCIHDINMIVTLLESFQDSLYLETFISYINKEHKNLSKVVFNDLFLKSFYKKFNQMIASLYEVIRSQKHEKIDNFPFIHFLNSEQILKIEKKLSFQFYFRLRDKLMNKNEFFAFFNQYIEKDKLVEFYYDYQIYVALVQRIRNKRDNLNLFQDFIKRFVEVSEFSEIKHVNSEYYVYKFLLLIKTMEFLPESESSYQTSNKIIEFLNFLSQKIEKNQMYHFSVACSFIGNTFFKQKLFESSIKAKSIAFESLKNVKITEPHFPLWFQKVDSKNLMKNILSFMILNQLSLEKNDYAEKFLQKLLMISPDNIADDLDNEIAQFVYYINTRDIKNAHQYLTNIQQKFQKAKLSTLDKKLYQALIDNLKLELLQTQKDEQAYQQQRRKSKESVNHLINHLNE